jgi:hypothetical protein
MGGTDDGTIAAEVETDVKPLPSVHSALAFLSLVNDRRTLASETDVKRWSLSETVLEFARSRTLELNRLLPVHPGVRYPGKRDNS